MADPKELAVPGWYKPADAAADGMAVAAAAYAHWRHLEDCAGRKDTTMTPEQTWGLTIQYHATLMGADVEPEDE